jgi:hypothetical protein
LDGTAGGGTTGPADGPVLGLDLVVRLDYGHFSLTGTYQPMPVGDAAAEPLRLLEEAIRGQGIAGTEGNEYVVVLSPHQNNFAMPMRVEVWAAEPPDDVDGWEEAFLTGLLVGPDGLAYDTPTLEGTAIPVPPGRYAVRITGRGFVNHGWPGSTIPGDEWRLQLWPATGPIRPRRLRAWADPAAALAAEGGGRSADLNERRAPDTTGGPVDPPAPRDPAT